MDILTAHTCATALQMPNTPLLGKVLRTPGSEVRLHGVYTMVAIVLLVLALSQVASAEPPLSVTVPGKTIALSQNEWAKMEDEASFAQNFEERTKAPWHKYGRVVTIYLLPLSEDRRLGLKISASEYVEFFVVHPGFVTVQTRVDKGAYWVLCRETFTPKAALPPVDISTYKPFLSTDAQQQLWQYYQVELDTTRHLLHTRF